MSIATLAQGARQSLARGLEALQAKHVPLGLLDVAQPVARAIGGLVDLELAPSEATPEQVELVLDALREALRLLQAPEYVEHPAAARGMKGVAEALASVVILARAVRESSLPANGVARPAPPASSSADVQRQSSPPAPAAAMFFRTAASTESTLTAQAPVALRAGAPTESTLTAAAPSLAGTMRPSLRSLAATPHSAEPAVVTRAVNAVMGPAPASLRVEAAPSMRSEAFGQHVDPATARSDPSQRPAAAPSIRAEAVQAIRSEPALVRSEPALVPREPVRLPEPPPLISTHVPQIRDARATTPSRAPVSIRREVVAERDLRAVDAPLGAHSPSNFYTGLAGGDVVVSGGLFVATYQVPKLGEKVLLKISMPGGYEFVAKAKVAWTRDMSGTIGPGSLRAGLAAPGFGAQFCEITDEGRRLIQRYVRNREPLFHEDSS